MVPPFHSISHESVCSFLAFCLCSRSRFGIGPGSDRHSTKVMISNPYVTLMTGYWITISNRVCFAPAFLQSRFGTEIPNRGMCLEMPYAYMYLDKGEAVYLFIKLEA
jgi:hypothetical protein